MVTRLGRARGIARSTRVGGASRTPLPRVIQAAVLGDLMLDVVLAPAAPLARGTDVPGRVYLRQGGSAATTARWFARLGAHSTLICAVGRDGPGRALVGMLMQRGVRVRALRVAGAPTGRIGVLVERDGERSFVADRGAADELSPAFIEPAWLESIDVLHLPAYSLLGDPLGEAALAAARLAHRSGAIVSVDLASSGPLLARGRRAALAAVRGVGPDVLFCTVEEAAVLLAGAQLTDLLGIAPTAVVKHGAGGATVMMLDRESRLRFEVATRALDVTDSTGAGDAFDAGFLASWVQARLQGGALASSLRRAALAGHRAAARELVTPRREVDLG